MMRVVRSISLGAIALCLPVAGSAATLTWPSSGPCGGALQGCINAASAGDVVLVATASMIHENLTIDKSLSLKGATGFTPWLSPNHNILLLNSNPRSNVIVVEGFYLDRCYIQAIQSSTASFNVAIRNLLISTNSDGRTPIHVRTAQDTPYGPVGFDVSGNRITIAPVSGSVGMDAISIQGGRAASMTGVVRSNVINHFYAGQYSAINLHSENSNPFQVDVIANHIAGTDYNAGVIFAQYDNVTSRVRYLDNLVVGQIDDAGMPGAYVATILGGTASIDIVNNTAVDCDRGILMNCGPEVGASWNGIVANNIVAEISHTGISIEEAATSAGTITNDHNLVFEALHNFFTPGPGTLFENPLFTGGGEYRLTDESPARNSGNPARVPAGLTTDLDGLPRQVQIVDRGAYENQHLATDALEGFPLAYRLHANVPNPFNPSTTIRYDLPAAGNVQLDVLDVQGRIVSTLVHGRVEAGRRETTWHGVDRDGRRVASGVYFYRLHAGSFTQTHRMVLLK